MGATSTMSLRFSIPDHPGGEGVEGAGTGPGLVTSHDRRCLRELFGKPLHPSVEAVADQSCPKAVFALLSSDASCPACLIAAIFPGPRPAAPAH